MGLLGGQYVQPLNGCKIFFFRVRTPKGYTFDTAVYQSHSITEAHSGLMKVYPGAKITALHETEFSADGLPVLKATVRKEPERLTPHLR